MVIMDVTVLKIIKILNLMDKSWDFWLFLIRMTLLDSDLYLDLLKAFFDTIAYAYDK